MRDGTLRLENLWLLAFVGPGSYPDLESFDGVEVIRPVPARATDDFRRVLLITTVSDGCAR